MTVVAFCDRLGIPGPTWYRWRAAGSSVKGPWPTPAQDAVEADAKTLAAGWEAWGHRKLAELKRVGIDDVEAGPVSDSTMYRALRRNGLCLPVGHAGEDFVDLADAQRRAETWCRQRAGLRVHGTTRQRPAEVFAAEEQPRLGPAPAELYDVPTYATAKVHRDHHIEVARSLYSIPGALIGARVEVRADRTLVRVFHRGQLIKVHPRQQPGHRSTDPDDLPSNKTVYAMRDLDRLRAMAAEHGPNVGAYASALLDIPLPWTKMRQVYALLGLVKKWGPARVDAACASALEHEQVNVGLIGRMLERGTENTTTTQPSPPGVVVVGRFARDPEHFATRAKGAAR